MLIIYTSMSTAAPTTPAEPTAREDSVLTVQELAHTLDAILAAYSDANQPAIPIHSSR